ncbi:MAG: hypothetical protein HUU49_04855 [Candidatus Buchananbacteria bacterium]|nr:hypothetical protein [Candidatus Buchananbacteria bacterium]
MNDTLKKATIFFTVIALLLALNIGSVLAQGTLDLTGKLKNVGGNAGYSAEVTENTLPNTVGNIIKALLSLLGIIFMSYIVYAGYLWMTAAGNDEKITKAKAILRGSIIGLIIVLAAYAITQFVLVSITEATGYSSAGS